MSELEIYQNFILWLGKTWWGLPASDQLVPLIKARYSVEEAAFLIGYHLQLLQLLLLFVDGGLSQTRASQEPGCLQLYLKRQSGNLQSLRSLC